MHIIVPLTKSPHPTGRWGPVEKQDWYVGLVKATALYRQLRLSKILVISAFQAEGEKSEIELYLWALDELGVPRSSIVTVGKGQETVGQLKIAAEYAQREGAELIVVSSYLHYPRVRWLCSHGDTKMKTRHYCTGGIPRPLGAVWDIVLTFVFPLVDCCGLRIWFLGKVLARRAKGQI